jgi:Leucine-rich repeat (LRR) protein
VTTRFDIIPQGLPAEVETIVMTGNNISTLYNGNFTHYSSLISLYLDDNNITFFPAGLADTTSSIQDLYLDGNPLTDIQDNAFENFSNLRTLSLRRTGLTTLRPAMFTGLSSLQTLYLDDSQLSSLPDNLYLNIPNVNHVSITNNNLQTIPDGMFTYLTDGGSDINIYLAGNPWSCDCNLHHLKISLTVDFPADVGILRCQWPTNQLMQNVAFSQFICSMPTVIIHPQNDSILTESSYTLSCIITGAPFPSVIWLKDNVPISYDERRYTSLYNASLYIADVKFEDGGTYQCVVNNSEGVDSSISAVLTVQELTCFDEIKSNHETDIDCGGIYCQQKCNQTQKCREDSDCLNGLVCLYAHSLPSQLHYISPNHYMSYTCEKNYMPRQLLNTRIQDVMSTDVFALNFTVEDDIVNVQSVMLDVIASQLNVAKSVISDVKITTVERTTSVSVPLVQVYRLVVYTE